jgi:hypothetical protein
LVFSTLPGSFEYLVSSMAGYPVILQTSHHSCSSTPNIEHLLEALTLL